MHRALVSVVASTAVLGITATAAPAAAETYLFTGAEQTYTVPAGVSKVHVVAVGGRGGSAHPGASGRPQGGSGALVTADLPVSPGQTLYVEVGSNAGACNVLGGGGGGFLGGANGGVFNGCGGGDESDVRTLPIGHPQSLAFSRVVVAGGGGGAGGAWEDQIGGTDGADADHDAADSHFDPGDPTPEFQIRGGQRGTLAGPGKGGLFNGSDGGLGNGGAGGGGSPYPGGGGGGGGYYGGGGGSGNPHANGSDGIPYGGAGGGGGASYILPSATGTIATDVSHIPSITITPVIPGATGQRAAALKKCMKRHGKARRRCKRKANHLPA